MSGNEYQVFIISGALVGESMYLRKFHDPGFQILNWLLLLLVPPTLLNKWAAAAIDCTDSACIA